MSTNESAPKRDRLLVKLDDLQNYNNADHAKRDAFRREFAKKAFGAKSNALIDKGSDEQVNKTLDGVFGKDGKMTRDQQQHHYNLGTGQKDGFGESAATAPAVVESPESASLRERTEAARRSLEATPEAPAAAPESNPADATVAPAEASVGGGSESADQTSEIEGNSFYNRAGSYFELAKMDGANKLKRYFSVGSTKHQNKLAALTAEKAEGESQEAYDARIAKAERNKKWGGRFRKIGAAVVASAAAYGIFRVGHSLVDSDPTQVQPNSPSNSPMEQPNFDHPSPNAPDHADQVALEHHNSLLEQFNFPDPAKSTEKLLGNDFNHPIPNGNNLPAFREALDQQWRGNSQEMAYYLSQSGIEGAPIETNFPNETAYLQAVKDYGDFLGDPKNVQIRIDKINELNGKFDGAQYSVENITNPYKSPYVDSVDGRVKIDPSVEQGGTITVVRFADGTELHVRNECGQPIEQIIQEYYAAPQGGGEYHNYVPEKPVYPEGGDTPPPYNPPEGGDTPPPVKPPEQPPVQPPVEPPVEPPVGPPVQPPTGGEESDKNPALSHRNDGGYTGNAGDLFSVDPNDFSNVDPTPTDPVRVDPAPVINNLLDGLNNGGSGGNFNTSTGDGKAVTPGTTSGDLLSGGGVGTADPTPNTSGGSGDTPRNSAGAVGE